MRDFIIVCILVSLMVLSAKLDFLTEASVTLCACLAIALLATLGLWDAARENIEVCKEKNIILSRQNDLLRERIRFLRSRIAANNEKSPSEN